MPLSTATTPPCDYSSQVRMKVEPMNPAPPVTSMLGGMGLVRSLAWLSPSFKRLSSQCSDGCEGDLLQIVAIT